MTQSRRGFLRQSLQGITAASLVIGFDVTAGSWITADAAPGSRHRHSRVPELEGVLFVDAARLAAAADDFGHIVHRTPIAVLLPGSVGDIVKIVRYARRHGLQVAMRGNGHSPFGQAQVAAGIVIDSSSLSTVHHIEAGSEGGGAWADVDAGARWSSLIRAAFAAGLTPRVLTDYQELSIGGTLSVGGIGGTTQTFGIQADNVLELEVVTGEGEQVTCSPRRRRALFDAALAGLGQCALIVRARLPLEPAPAEVQVFNLFYDDIRVYVEDQRRLLREGKFEHLQGQVVARPDGAGWRFMIEAGAFYTAPALPDPSALLEGLRDVRADATNLTQSYLDYAFRLEPLIAFLISLGVWELPHPWIDLFVPASVAPGFVGGVVSNLTAADTGGGPILFYPVDTRRIRRPFFRLPDERECFLFSVLRTADPPTPDTVLRMLADNRELYDRVVALGGTRYANGAFPFDAGDWRRHFGERWPSLVQAKRRYDPDHVLTPGQGIFSP